MRGEMTEHYCIAVTYPQTRETPRELCDELVSTAGDLCELHDYTDQDAADDAREHDYETKMGY